MFKAKLKYFFFNDISQCHQIYERLRERYMNVNRLRKMFSSVMMNYIFVSDSLSMFFFLTKGDVDKYFFMIFLHIDTFIIMGMTNAHTHI